MLETLVNTENIARAPYNTSKSKQHYSFPKSKRKSFQTSDIKTEYTNNLRLEINDKKSFNKLKNFSFGIKFLDSNFDKHKNQQDLRPFNTIPLKNSKSVSFGLSREVILSESHIQQLH